MQTLKDLWAKLKWVIAGLTGILGIVLFFFIEKKIRARDKMNYELERIRLETEEAHLEQDAQEKKVKLEKLQVEEKAVRERIKYIEQIETHENREVSIEELDAFFDKRGF